MVSPLAQTENTVDAGTWGTWVHCAAAGAAAKRPRAMRQRRRLATMADLHVGAPPASRSQCRAAATRRTRIVKVHKMSKGEERCAKSPGRGDRARHGPMSRANTG